MRVTKDDAHKRIDEIVSKSKLSIPLVLEYPSERTVRSALRAPKQPMLKIVIAEPLELFGARGSKSGAIMLQGAIKLTEYELESIQSIKSLRDGGYSFVGVHYYHYTWEYNYNAGNGHHKEWTTYRIKVSAEGYATYTIIDKKIYDR